MSNVTSNNFRTVEEVDRDRESAADWWNDLHVATIIVGKPTAKRVPCIEGCKNKELGGVCTRWELDGGQFCRDFVTGRIFNDGYNSSRM